MGNTIVKILGFGAETIFRVSVFREKVPLTYKNKNLAMPLIRMLSTLLILSLVILAGSFLMRSYFNREDIQWNQNTVITNLANDTTDVDLTPEDEFEIRLSLILPQGFGKDLSNYLTVKATNNTYSLNPNRPVQAQSEIEPTE